MFEFDLVSFFSLLSIKISIKEISFEIIHCFSYMKHTHTGNSFGLFFLPHRNIPIAIDFIFFSQ